MFVCFVSSGKMRNVSVPSDPSDPSDPWPLVLTDSVAVVSHQGAAKRYPTTVTNDNHPTTIINNNYNNNNNNNDRNDVIFALN